MSSQEREVENKATAAFSLSLPLLVGERLSEISSLHAMETEEEKRDVDAAH